MFERMECDAPTRPRSRVGWSLPVGAGLALLSAGCSVLNKLDPCESEPREFRVNQRGDQSEFTSHPRAAARLFDSNRILVAYLAQSTTGSTSEVRIALLDATTGERATVCTSEFEHTLSEADVVAHGASVVPVELTVNGMTAKAAASWTEGVVNTEVKVVFLDGKGCPLGKPFSPMPQTGVVTAGIGMAWSPTKKQVLAAYHDYRTVFASWLSDNSPPAPIEIATAERINDPITTAIAEDGRGAIAWASFANLAALTESRAQIFVALLGTDGAVRPGPTGAPEPFSLVFPVDSTGGISVAPSMVVRSDRYAFAVSLAQSSWARQVVYVTELSADSGATITAPFRVDPDTGAAHSNSSLAYGPGEGLVAAWMSAQYRGTVARLFGRGGERRFNAVSCDEGPFAVGARAEQGIQGQPSALVIDDRAWLFHPGQPSYDAVGMGVVGWSMSWTDLWPAK
jgi:hypothetical protein